MRTTVDQQHRQHRALRARDLLRQLWGDAPPPGPDPDLALVLDAVAEDDRLGTLQGYVVQGDRLGLDALAELVRRCPDPSAVRLLPRELALRLVARGCTRGAAADGPAPVREAVGPLVGGWHLDADRLVLSWDDDCARVLHRVRQPRGTPLVVELDEWTHPEDRTAVAESMAACVEEGTPLNLRFRSLDPRGVPVPQLTVGRRVVDEDGHVHVVGFLQGGGEAPG